MTKSNLTVARRLALAFGALILALIVVTGIGVTGMRWEAQMLSDMGTRDMPMVKLASEIDGNLTDEAIEYERILRLAYALQAQDPSAKDQFAAARQALAKRVDESQKAFDELRKLISQAGVTNDTAVVAAYSALGERVESMDKAQTAFEQRVQAAVDLVGEGRFSEARSMSEGVEKHRRLAANEVEGFVEAITKLTGDNVAGAWSGARLRIAMIFGLSTGAFAVAIGLAVWVTRSITRTLGAEPFELSAAVQRVAAGDLTAQLALRPGDESSVMAHVKAMQASLTAVVAHVRGNAESVAAGSVQIAQGNADLSQRTEEQASALEETAATMEELSSTVKNNADNARQADQLAKGASEVARRSGDVVGEVVATMKTISDSSQRIAEIIGVIDGIAFQTNILALNAAVEAARAGEQGRGFAVVAAEVRGLAQRSAEAAREIKSLIGASVERVERGSALVEQAGTTIGEVVDSIMRVTDIVSEISSASAEQASGVGQVGEAVAQMDQVTQQNAALVEQSAAAAESLKTQAQALVQAVQAFKLTPGVRRPDAEPAALVARVVGPERTDAKRTGIKRASRGQGTAQRAATTLPAAQGATVATATGADDWTSF